MVTMAKNILLYLIVLEVWLHYLGMYDFFACVVLVQHLVVMCDYNF